MKNLSVLGSTGSIGVNVLNVALMHKDRFRVRALACRSNLALLKEQILLFEPDLAVVGDAEKAKELESILPDHVKTSVMYGNTGFAAAASMGDVDLVVSAIVGAAGLAPTLAAIEAGKQVALANKETLVTAGSYVMKRAKQCGVSIIPVDSEHSAIFQSLMGQRKEDVDHLLLTASGGPFRATPKEAFAKITLKEALNHPTWEMGRKITIDSATLMNKGLEVIEAVHLFDVSTERIKVVVHPQSIVHSMVAFKDGSVIAQMGLPDMKGAIAYALTYPERLNINHPAPDFAQLSSLNFEAPDFNKFPCLSLAFDAVSIGSTMPAVMNAANEMAVNAFLKEEISFNDIPYLIRKTMDLHDIVTDPGLDAFVYADEWARRAAVAQIEKRRSI